MLPEAGPLPRRARQLIPAGFPRRGELIAAGFVLLLLAHLLLAQLTLVLAVLFAVTGRLTRWRWYWLLTPAMAGLAWMMAAGTGEALAGFAAGPASVLAHLVGAPSAGHAARPLAALNGIGGWLPRQFPVALPLAAAEAALAGWLAWLHTDEWAVPPPRPGAVAALRAAWAARRIRSGSVLTRDGVALGIMQSTGAVTELTWPEMSGGVLVAGADARQVTLTCLQLVHAAVRRRKAVIVLDDGHDAGLVHALAATCLATGTPLRRDDGGRAAAYRSPSSAPDTMAEPSGVPRGVVPPGGNSASQLWGRGLEHSAAESPDEPPTDLGQVLSERSLALVPAGSAGSAAALAADVAALGARLRRIGVDGDGLIWVPAAQRLPAPVLAALARDGAAAGLPVLVGAESPAAAAALAGIVGALLVHRVTDRDLADRLAAATGTRLLPATIALGQAGQPFPAAAGQPYRQPAGQLAEQPTALTPCPVIEPRSLLTLRPGEFVLVASVPRRRVVARGRLVPARLPRPAGQRRQP
jgi:hypothetical protein